MLRDEIINRISELFEDPKYLEVGVWQGGTFNQVKARTKVAVDPKFDFDHNQRSSDEPNNKYYQVTSNEYFVDASNRSDKFDVIFLDGLHTFEQTLTDLLHSVDLLNENGIIILDDIIPDSYPASLRSEQECYYFRQSVGDTSTHWMGDVYKLAFFINAYMLNWSYCTVAETHGQLVMWRHPRASSELSSALISDISNKSYIDAVLHKNLFNIAPLEAIISQILSSRPSQKSNLATPSLIEQLESASGRPKISYYFQRIEGLAYSDDVPDLIAMHVKSFEQNGWEVVALDERDAKQHPLYSFFDDENSAFAASRNGWEYTRACYMRWLAYATAGHPFADFDVVNYGFTPKDAKQMARDAEGPKLLSGAGAMGLFAGKDYDLILSTFQKYASAPFVDGALKEDVNDMTILIQCLPEIFSLIGNEDVRIARDYTCPGWGEAKLVHYPYHYTPQPRAKTANQARPLPE
ncbi:class I SAM-dependent methyltransferase [Methylobacterium brachiatum]|uniref:class I SAM-dependent methyltransferase n=1 Tax=Methylobacterium brachiatum TaxID=269660 RepID=UPI0008E5FFD4|nr:class I SAM-dependent methyltransferase [Methylobacterium brachiatum]SFJ67340.1 Methyltransferase domain-containing protein [Methylobacterium brachiatum]